MTVGAFASFNFEIEPATRTTSEDGFSFFKERKLFAVIAKVEFEPNVKDKSEKKNEKP